MLILFLFDGLNWSVESMTSENASTYGVSVLANRPGFARAYRTANASITRSICCVSVGSAAIMRNRRSAMSSGWQAKSNEVK